MCERVNECVIEWLRGEKTATVTMPPNTRLYNKILKLASRTSIITVLLNKDGSMVAHVPSSWVKISPPRAISEEHKKRLAEQLKKANKERKKENKDG